MSVSIVIRVKSGTSVQLASATNDLMITPELIIAIGEKSSLQ